MLSSFPFVILVNVENLKVVIKHISRTFLTFLCTSQQGPQDCLVCFWPSSVSLAAKTKLAHWLFGPGGALSRSEQPPSVAPKPSMLRQLSVREM